MVERFGALRPDHVIFTKLDEAASLDLRLGDLYARLGTPHQLGLGVQHATVGQRDVLLDPETHLGDYTLPVTVGPTVANG